MGGLGCLETGKGREREAEGKGSGEDGTFTFAAASPGGLRSVERFAAVEEAREWREG